MPTRRRRLGPAMLDWYPEESTPGDKRGQKYVKTWGLLSYGVSIKDLDRPDLRGRNTKRRKTADLPVEQPTKFEFVINLKTAK